MGKQNNGQHAFMASACAPVAPSPRVSGIVPAVRPQGQAKAIEETQRTAAAQDEAQYQNFRVFQGVGAANSERALAGRQGLRRR